MNVKRFHMEWDNHLVEKERYSWEPHPILMEVESEYKSVSFECELEDGTIIKGSKVYHNET
jgi:hypothetical protein